MKNTNAPNPPPEVTRQQIEETREIAELLKKLPQQVQIKFLYMAQGAEMVSEMEKATA